MAGIIPTIYNANGRKQEISIVRVLFGKKYGWHTRVGMPSIWFLNLLKWAYSRREAEYSRREAEYSRRGSLPRRYPSGSPVWRRAAPPAV